MTNESPSSIVGTIATRSTSTCTPVADIAGYPEIAIGDILSFAFANLDREEWSDDKLARRADGAVPSEARRTVVTSEVRMLAVAAILTWQPPQPA